MNQIISTQEELNKALFYELDMFKNTCLAWKNKPVEISQFNKRILIESLALHSRVLIDFFYGNKGKYLDNIIAQDFLPEDIRWSEIRPEMSYFLKKVKIKANKQLAHLCLGRIELIRKDEHGWQFDKVYQELGAVINLFLKILREGKK